MRVRLRLGASILAVLCAAGLQSGLGAEGHGAADGALVRARQRQAELRTARRADRDLPALRSLARQGRKIRLRAGDLLTASSFKSSALRLQLDEDKTRIRRHALDTDFVPRAMAYESEGSVAAIAAVSKVLLLYTESGEVAALDGPGTLAPAFGFVNDVLFVDGTTLLIADLGEEISGKAPADGHLWRYDLVEGTFDEVGIAQAFSNPAQLARGPLGEVYVVDSEGGPQITPIFEFYSDNLYELAGQQLLNVRNVYTGPGLQATGLDVGPDGRFWIGSVSELVILSAGILSYPCGLTQPFDYLTTVLATATGSALVIDGTGSPPRRTLYELDDLCAATVISNKGKLKEARGLTRVPPESS